MCNGAGDLELTRNGYINKISIAEKNGIFLIIIIKDIVDGARTFSTAAVESFQKLMYNYSCFKYFFFAVVLSIFLYFI